jgi:DNA-binding PadR family transcriptional regulator
LPSGTVYPILRRLNGDGALRSRWERDGAARQEQRPPRRYYELTPGGTLLARQAIDRLRPARAARLAPRKVEG